VSCNNFPPLRRYKKLIVLLPPSILSVEDSLIDKTNKAGFISRILSIFRVDEVILYKDEETRDFDEKMLNLILNYQVIPPHIKKKVIKKSKILKYAGILPPLRLVNHDPPKKAEVGKILDGYIEKCNKDYCLIYLGLLGKGVLDRKKLNNSDKNSKIITVKIKSTNGKILLEKASWENLYTGYKVSKTNELKKEINKLKNDKNLIIGTSKLGDCFDKKIQDNLKNDIDKSNGIALVFGGPHAELYQQKEEFDYILNTVFNQGTLTVRTEEALAITLSLLNNLV
jgi:predicted SPOUT superfamily RNA methylase MTH1